MRCPHDYAEEAERRQHECRACWWNSSTARRRWSRWRRSPMPRASCPTRPGMHGPAATLDELAKVLCPARRMAASCRKVGVVDYSIGKGVAPGVFVIADMSHPRISERMEDLKMGKGPYLHVLSSLSSDLARSAAVLRARRALRQARHGAAAEAGGRGLRGRQEGHAARRNARRDRRILLSRPGS